MIDGLSNIVKLRESDHKYFDITGAEYESISKFRGRFKEPFNKELVAHQVAKSEGRSAQEVMAEWDAKTAEGTRIHNSIERYSKSGIILPADKDLEALNYNLADQYKGYYRIMDEVIIYNQLHGIAGTADRFLLTTSSKKCVIDITDWKTNYKGIHQKEVDKHGKPVNKYMLGCLSHLQNSKYNDYALQLSIYAWMLQELTGRKIGQLNIHWINPEEPLDNFKIPVPFMKYEVEAMLEERRLLLAA